MFDYDYFEELAEAERIYRNRYNKPMTGSYAEWNSQSWGSAACTSTTMDAIREAYNESRICEEW